jgi:hypothetical protein
MMATNLLGSAQINQSFGTVVFNFLKDYHSPRSGFEWLRDLIKICSFSNNYTDWKLWFPLVWQALQPRWASPSLLHVLRLAKKRLLTWVVVLKTREKAVTSCRCADSCCDDIWEVSSVMQQIFTYTWNCIFVCHVNLAPYSLYTHTGEQEWFGA